MPRNHFIPPACRQTGPPDPPAVSPPPDENDCSSDTRLAPPSPSYGTPLPTSPKTTPDPGRRKKLLRAGHPGSEHDKWHGDIPPATSWPCPKIPKPSTSCQSVSYTH